MGVEHLQSLSDEYERAEADRAALAGAARRGATAASEFNAEAYRNWIDVAAAYES